MAANDFQSLMDAIGRQPEQQSMWDGLVNARPQQLAQAMPSAPQIHNIEDGPEYNKWIDVLAQRGTIRLPMERDNPQQWLSRPDMLDMLEKGGIDRRDLPDGSVVLSRKALTS